MSHIQQQRELFAQNKIQVMKHLCWDELQYHNLQFDYAFEWLQYGQQMPRHWRDAMVRIPGFWKFWINEWNLRDVRCFIPNVNDYKRGDLERVYKSIHNYKFIEAHPSKRQFDDAYAIMIGDTFDDIKNLELCQK